MPGELWYIEVLQDFQYQQFLGIPSNHNTLLLVWGLGFRVEGLGFRVEGLGLRV